MLAHRQRIGKHLGRVELVGQTVEHRHACILGQLFHHILPKAAIFDAVKHPPQNTRRILNAFLMPDLAGGRLQISYPCSLVARGHFKRATGAGRCFLKNQGNVFSLHPLHLVSCFFSGFQFGGKVEVGGDFFGREIQKFQEMAVFQAHVVFLFSSVGVAQHFSPCRFCRTSPTFCYSIFQNAKPARSAASYPLSKLKTRPSELRLAPRQATIVCGSNRLRSQSVYRRYR